jgi:hypothetical protein
MEMQKKNIDEFIEEKIKGTLSEKTDDKLADRIMEQILLQEKYRNEDIRTGKLVKRITLSGISFIFAAGIIIIFALAESGVIDGDMSYIYIKGMIDFLRTGFYDLLGFGNPVLSLLTIIGFAFVVTGYFLIDRKVFKS